MKTLNRRSVKREVLMPIFIIQKDKPFMFFICIQQGGSRLCKITRPLTCPVKYHFASMPILITLDRLWLVWV